jgi:phytoene/squalene synthetase
MLSAKFYKSHLEKVSRSFAFCIEELRGDLQHNVALAYLLFRVLDTIEDSAWTSKAAQKECFELFDTLLDVKTPFLDNIVFGNFMNHLLSANSKEVEKELVRESRPLFENLINLPEKERAPLLLSLATMSKGMQLFALEKNHKIQNMADLNSYCYYVAGCIGELLTEWTFEKDKQSRREESVHFGLFLQKINILKDFMDDSHAGRSFLWSWKDVAQSLKLHSTNAFNYILQIPEDKNDYKVFCAWSFFLGLASYPSIEKSLELGERKKISRIEAWQTLNKVKKNILDNKKLSVMYETLSAHLPAEMESKKIDLRH